MRRESKTDNHGERFPQSCIQIQPPQKSQSGTKMMIWTVHITALNRTAQNAM